MKYNTSYDHVLNSGWKLIPVRFEFIHPTASRVCIAGCFNDWIPEATSIHPAGGGRWLKATVLAPGSYQYCLVVDGEWMADPLAKDYVPNPFGGMNSVLQVQSSDALRVAVAGLVPWKIYGPPKPQGALKVHSGANATGRSTLHAGLLD